MREGLRVGHHQGRRAAEPIERVAELALLDDHAHGVAVQQVADRLHLRQDEAALGGFHVDRHHQHGHLARRDQVGRDRRRIEELVRRGFDECLAQVEDAAALGGHGFHAKDFRPAELFKQRGLRLGEIRLVEDDDGRDLSFAQLAEDAFFELAPAARGGDNQAQVGAVEDLPGLLHPQFAQRPFVVDAGRIDEQHRPDGQDFHRLFHRVGGRAGDRGDDRDLLLGQRIEERRLARVAAAEEADVEAEGFGVVVIRRMSFLAPNSLFARRSSSDRLPGSRDRSARNDMNFALAPSCATSRSNASAASMTNSLPS